MAKEIVDVETIDILLIGDRDDIAEAIRSIDANYRKKIVEIIRRKALSANSHDLSDIYQEVILGIYQDALEGKYNPDHKALQSFIYRIASNKAVDWLRKKYAQKRKVDPEQDVLIDSITEIIEDSNLKEAWQYAQRNEVRTIILEKIRKLIPTLKGRQRQVAEIILMNLFDVLNDSEIKEQILHYHGEDITTLAVKSARQEVYSKIKEALSTTIGGEYLNDRF